MEGKVARGGSRERGGKRGRGVGERLGEGRSERVDWGREDKSEGGRGRRGGGVRKLLERWAAVFLPGSETGDINPKYHADWKKKD